MPKEKLELVIHPDERLKKTCGFVSKFDSKLEDFIKDMAHFMFTGLPWGRPAGLAAPQIGKNIRLFITNEGLDKGGGSGNFRAFINPEIIWATKAPEEYCQEGCFSLEREKMDYPVKRKTSIRVRYQDLKGETHEERFNGMKAFVIQHEMDHLNGVLICDKQ